MEKLNLKTLLNGFKSLSLENRMLLLLATPFNFLFYYLVRYVTTPRFHYCLMLPFEESIPFLPWTMIIYWGCYIFWIINFCICGIYDKEKRSQFIKAYYIGEIVSFIIMFIFPSTMTRPEITGADFFSKIMTIQYTIDAADNLLPSIHCFLSYLCWVGVRKNPIIPKWYQHASLVMALLVFISTLTVKQHVVVDVIAAVIVTEIAYKISAYLSNRKKSI